MMKYFIKKCLIIILSNILKLFWFFKIRENLILFISFNGKQVSGCPKHIYDYIRDRYNKNNDLQLCWLLRRENLHLFEMENITTVDQVSLRGLYLLLTAKFIITNDRLDSYIPIRNDQVLVNTWHGGGLFKKTHSNSLTKDQRAYVQWLDRRDAKRTSLYISGSKAWTNKVVRQTFGYSGSVSNTGSPRNDIFFNQPRTEIKKRLGISEMDGIILFAPTYRSANINDHEKLMIDRCIKIWECREKKRFRFLYRGHHNSIGVNVLGDYQDVTNFPDMQGLLSISDVFISDFTSALWDFSISMKPSFIFAPDIDEYNKTNGFESDFHSWPFKIAKNNNDLANNMHEYDQAVYRNLIDRYHKNYQSVENRNATERAVRAIFKI